MGVRFFSILFALIIPCTLTAQKVYKKKKGELEIGTGLTFFGPAPQMAKIMVDYNFDQTTQPFWGDRKVEHPDYPPFGLSFHVSYARYIREKFQLGLILQFNGLRTVKGYHIEAEDLDVAFSNTSIILTSHYKPNQYWEIRAGPALMVNDSYRSDIEVEYDPYFTTITPGVLIGLNAKIWDSEKMYAKIGAHALITGRVETGPFTVESMDGFTVSVRKSELGYSHVNLFLLFGYKLR
jgi:hypothetical protein